MVIIRTTFLVVVTTLENIHKKYQFLVILRAFPVKMAFLTPKSNIFSTFQSFVVWGKGERSVMSSKIKLKRWQCYAGVFRVYCEVYEINVVTFLCNLLAPPNNNSAFF